MPQEDETMPKTASDITIINTAKNTIEEVEDGDVYHTVFIASGDRRIHLRYK